MGIQLHVDIREHAWIDAYSALLTKSAPDNIKDTLEFHKVSLELGDFQIIWPEEGLHYVFERKTFQDLAASIKDGRYREQKARLMAHFRPAQITYILEDVNTQRIFYGSARSATGFFGLSKAAYQSFLLHARYRDGIHVHVSSGIEETMYYLLEFIQRLRAHPEYFRTTTGGVGMGEATGGDRGYAEGGGGEEAPSYINQCAIKSRKKDNITPTVCFQLQLGQIPGISSTLAKSLSQRVGSMTELMEKLTPLGAGQAIAWLQETPLIGKKKAEIICQYLGLTDKDKE